MKEKTQRKEISQATHIITAIFLTMAIIAGAVALTLACKQLYYMEVEDQNLAEKTGYSYEEIVENYDALVRYNQDIRQAELGLTLPVSEEGAYHFAEVKNIFIFIQYVMLPVGLFGAYFGYRKIKKQKEMNWEFLKWSAVFSVAIPAIVGSFVIAAWDQVFVWFHQLFFRNDYWIFDPEKDPIINMLPDSFFMHCAIFIVVLTLIGGLVCFILYRNNSKKNTIKPLELKKTAKNPFMKK